MTTTPVPTIREAESLCDWEIDALIDSHVFNRSPQCSGRCILASRSGAISAYYCVQCHARVEYTLVQRFFSSGMTHQRSIPHYTQNRLSAWQIIEEIKKHPAGAQVVFLLTLRAFHHLSQHTSFSVWLLFEMTAREIALSALRAVGVINERGYIVK